MKHRKTKSWTLTVITNIANIKIGEIVTRANSGTLFGCSYLLFCAGFHPKWRIQRGHSTPHPAAHAKTPSISALDPLFPPTSATCSCRTSQDCHHTPLSCAQYGSYWKWSCWGSRISGQVNRWCWFLSAGVRTHWRRFGFSSFRP